jgi:hypothetical protein
LFGFSDTVVSASRTLSNLIRDETTSERTKRDSEDGGNGRGPSFAEGKQIGGLREEDGFLDITGDDPGEEVSVDDASPKDGGDGDKGEWTEEDLDNVLDGLAGTVEFEDAPKGHTRLGRGVAAGRVDRVAGGVETVRCIHEMIAVVVGLGEEEDGREEIDAGPDRAEPPEPLQAELLSDPSVDDTAHRRAGGKGKGVDGHLYTTLMKEEHWRSAMFEMGSHTISNDGRSESFDGTAAETLEDTGAEDRVVVGCVSAPDTGSKEDGEGGNDDGALPKDESNGDPDEVADSHTEDVVVGQEGGLAGGNLEEFGVGEEERGEAGRGIRSEEDKDAGDDQGRVLQP